MVEEKVVGWKYLLRQRIPELHLLQQFFLLVAEPRVLRRGGALKQPESSLKWSRIYFGGVCKVKKPSIRVKKQQTRRTYGVHHLRSVVFHSAALLSRANWFLDWSVQGWRPAKRATLSAAHFFAEHAPANGQQSKRPGRLGFPRQTRWQMDDQRIWSFDTFF